MKYLALSNICLGHTYTLITIGSLGIRRMYRSHIETSNTSACTWVAQSLCLSLSFHLSVLNWHDRVANRLVEQVEAEDVA